jgi:hypothetical protein
MADTNYDADYDEYTALEAEAESLARNDKKPVANDPNMVPARTAASGRGPRPSSVTVVPSKQQQQSQPVQRAAPVKNPDQEIEELEEAEEQMAEEEEITAAQPKKERWIAFHQPEKIGIVNAETQEIIDGYKDIGSATGMAKVLNEIDSIIVSGGYN